MEVKHTLVMTGIKQTVIVILLMRASRIHRTVYDFSVLIRNIFSRKVSKVFGTTRCSV